MCLRARWAGPVHLFANAGESVTAQFCFNQSLGGSGSRPVGTVSFFGYLAPS